MFRSSSAVKVPNTKTGDGTIFRSGGAGRVPTPNNLSGSTSPLTSPSNNNPTTTATNSATTNTNNGSKPASPTTAMKVSTPTTKFAVSSDLAGFESMMAQMTPEEERKVREDQKRQEAIIAQRVRRSLIASNPADRDAAAEATAAAAAKKGGSGSGAGGGRCPTPNTPPLPPITRGHSQQNMLLINEQNNTNNGDVFGATPPAGQNTGNSSPRNNINRSPSSTNINNNTNNNINTNGGCDSTTTSTNGSPNFGHHNHPNLPHQHQQHCSPTTTDRLTHSYSSNSLGLSLINTMSSLTSFTTVRGTTGNVVPNGYIEDCGLLMCQEALKTVKGKKKNQSPFPSDKYFSMLPEVHPSKKDKVLLCIDIDETLLHSTLQIPGTPTYEQVRREEFDKRMPIESSDGSPTRAFVCIHVRPHVQEFLEFVAQRFDVAIFTASQSNYANLVMEAVDPKAKIIGKQRLYREHCAEGNGSRVKDLSLLGRPLDRIALLDNNPSTYLFQPRNAIPIESYFFGKSDTELKKLLPMLDRLATCKSVYDVLDPYNAYLISPEPDVVMTMPSPVDGSPRSLQSVSSFAAASMVGSSLNGKPAFHSPVASHKEPRFDESTSSPRSTPHGHGRPSANSSPATRGLSGSAAAAAAAAGSASSSATATTTRTTTTRQGNAASLLLSTVNTMGNNAIGRSNLMGRSGGAASSASSASLGNSMMSSASSSSSLSSTTSPSMASSSATLRQSTVSTGTASPKSSSGSPTTSLGYQSTNNGTSSSCFSQPSSPGTKHTSSSAAAVGMGHDAFGSNSSAAAAANGGTLPRI